MSDETCTLCGRIGWMGARINDDPYCHGRLSYEEELQELDRPTCYEIASRDLYGFTGIPPFLDAKEPTP